MAMFQFQTFHLRIEGLTHPPVIWASGTQSRPLRGVARGVSDLDALKSRFTTWIKPYPVAGIKHLREIMAEIMFMPISSNPHVSRFNTTALSLILGFLVESKCSSVTWSKSPTVWSKSVAVQITGLHG